MNKPKIYNVTATGSTTPRDIRDRFADVINVRDFGAKGDGVTDDYEAIHAALASDIHGVIYFPHGTYCTSKTIKFGANSAGRKVIDLGGSAIRWIGESGGLLMDIYGNANGVMNGSLQGAVSQDVPADGAIAGTVLRLRGYACWCRDVTVNWFLVSGIDLGANGDIDGVEASGSTCAAVTNVNVSNSLRNLPWAYEGGATGIRILCYDNRIDTAIVLRCHHSVEIKYAGNRFANCHFCEMSNTDLGEERGDTNSAAVYINTDSSARTGINTFSGCYFDNHQIVIKNARNHLISTTMDGCYYWSYPTSVAAPIYKYMMAGYSSPIEIVNFTEATNQYVMLYGVRESVKFGTGYRDLCTEHYTAPATSKNTDAGKWTPYLCRYRVQNHEPVLVCLNQTLATGVKYLIGGVLFAYRTEMQYAAARFTVGFENGSLGGQVLECDYDGYSDSWTFNDKTNVPSKLFKLALGEPQDVTVASNTSIFVPIYLEVIGSSTAENQVSAWIEVDGVDTTAYLVNSQQSERPWTSTSYLNTTMSAPLPFFDSVDFNDFNTQGRFHVRFGSGTLNPPVVSDNALDCVLQVDLISSAPNVTGSRRTIQTATVINATSSTSPTMWVRKGFGYPATTWSAWFQVV